MTSNSDHPLPAVVEQTASSADVLADSRHRARLWDVVIRAHYLAHDMREICAKAGMPASGLGLVVGELLADWATDFGTALEQREAERALRAADQRRRGTVVRPGTPRNDP